MLHPTSATLGFMAAIDPTAPMLVLYLVSLGVYVWFLFTDRAWVGRLASIVLATALLIHYLKLIERARLLDSVPYRDLYGSMSLFAWLLGITYLGLESLHRQRSVGPFVLPVILILVLVSAFLTPSVPPPPPPARGTLFALHVTSNILAYSAFALSFVLSLIYLLQNRVLRDRRLGKTFWKFPALDALERMSRSSVIVGLVSMAVGMIFGFIWVHRLWGIFWISDPKVTASLVILGIYAFYLWVGRKMAWRGPRASVLCVISFVFVLFSYTIVNFYLSHYHRFF